jgi:hypothetical protein
MSQAMRNLYNNKSVDQQAEELMSAPTDSTFVNTNLGPVQAYNGPQVDMGGNYQAPNMNVNPMDQQKGEIDYSGESVETDPNVLAGNSMLGNAYDGESLDLSFDMNDPESVKRLQMTLGVTADGMFGPETEKAYRAATNKQRVEYGEDPYNFAPAGGVNKGSFLGNAFQNIGSGYNKLDKKLGGFLPFGKFRRGMVER